MLFWTSKLDGQLIILRCWTEDFETFTKTEVFGEFGMDLTIAEDKGRYYMVSKNGPDELIQQNVADKLDGPWEKVSDRIGKEGGMPAGEGPLVFRDNVDQNKVRTYIRPQLCLGRTLEGGRRMDCETDVERKNILVAFVD